MQYCIESSTYGEKLSGRAMLSGMPNAPKGQPSPREVAYSRVIEAKRREKKVTQGALAEAAGVSQSQVSRILSGERPVTLHELLAMLDRLGLRLEDVAHEASGDPDEDPDALPAVKRGARRIRARERQPQHDA